MTDRIKGFWVALERDIRDDDVQPIIDAVRQLRGVLAVEANVASPADWINRQRVRRELEERLWAALKRESDG